MGFTVAFWFIHLEVANVTVWLPDPRHLSRKQLLYSQKRPSDIDETPLVLGSIHCYDTLSLDLISNLAKEAKARSSATHALRSDTSCDLWWRLLVYGCHLASTHSAHVPLFNKTTRASIPPNPPTVALRLTLDPNYIQHSWQRMDMIG